MSEDTPNVTPKFEQVKCALFEFDDDITTEEQELQLLSGMSLHKEQIQAAMVGAIIDMLRYRVFKASEALTVDLSDEASDIILEAYDKLFDNKIDKIIQLFLCNSECQAMLVAFMEQKMGEVSCGHAPLDKPIECTPEQECLMCALYSKVISPLILSRDPRGVELTEYVDNLDSIARVRSSLTNV